MGGLQSVDDTGGGAHEGIAGDQGTQALGRVHGGNPLSVRAEGDGGVGYDAVFVAFIVKGDAGTDAATRAGVQLHLGPKGPHFAS
jgi:hypothetical protein